MIEITPDRIQPLTEEDRLNEITPDRIVSLEDISSETITSGRSPSGLLSNLGKRLSNIKGEWEVKPEKSWFEQPTNIQQLPRTVLRTSGQIAGGIGDVIGAGMGMGYRTLIPEGVRSSIEGGIKSGFETPISQGVLDIVGKATDIYKSFKEKFPEEAKDIEASANIASLMPIGRGKQVLGVIPEKKMSSLVEKEFSRAVRPSVALVPSATSRNKYFSDAGSAMKEIIKNKKNLELTDEFGDAVRGMLPQNLKQFSESIDQTKKAIFREYDELARETGKKGVTIDLNPIIKELDIIKNNKALQTVSPDVIKYTRKFQNQLIKSNSLTPLESQDAIAALNARLLSIKDYSSVDKSYVDALVVNKLRSSLDDAIEKMTEANYQKLKKSYGALKTIEKDVNRRVIVDLRKNSKGLIDYTDIFSAYAAIRGIIRKDPSTIAAAGGATLLKTLLKRINDPNVGIKNLFANMEKMMRGQYKTLPKGKIAQSMGQAGAYGIIEPSED